MKKLNSLVGVNEGNKGEQVAASTRRLLVVCCVVGVACEAATSSSFLGGLRSEKVVVGNPKCGFIVNQSHVPRNPHSLVRCFNRGIPRPFTLDAAACTVGQSIFVLTRLQFAFEANFGGHPPGRSTSRLSYWWEGRDGMGGGGAERRETFE